MLLCDAYSYFLQVLMLNMLLCDASSYFLQVLMFTNTIDIYTFYKGGLKHRKITDECSLSHKLPFLDKCCCYIVSVMNLFGFRYVVISNF